MEPLEHCGQLAKIAISERMDVEVLLNLIVEADSQTWKRSIPRLPSADLQQVALRAKQEADRQLRHNLETAQRIATRLIELGQQAQVPTVEAMGWQVDGNVKLIGSAEFPSALTAYRTARELLCDEPIKSAETAIGEFGALARLGRYDEAEAVADNAIAVLHQRQQWETLARLQINTALLHHQRGDDRTALALLDEADRHLRQSDVPHPLRLAGIAINRANALRNLGQYNASLTASETAIALLDSPIETARAQAGMAITHYVFGNYNEALRLFGKAREAYSADNRIWDRAEVDLFAAMCWLQLRRLPRVLDICDRLTIWFEQRGVHNELARTCLLSAEAYAGMGAFDDALTALEQAQAIFMGQNNVLRSAEVDLIRATLLLEQGNLAETQHLAAQCAVSFTETPLFFVQAKLLEAEALLALGDKVTAQQVATHACDIARQKQLTPLLPRAEQLLGRICSEPATALAHFDTAITILEALSGRLITPFRTDFLQNKEAIFADAFQLSLELGDARQALVYAERAKSRVLTDLLALQLDARVEARESADSSLADELNTLIATRNQLVRRTLSDITNPQIAPELTELEAKIAQLRESLLLQSSTIDLFFSTDFGRTLQETQHQLDPQTAIITYFSAHENWYAFLITHTSITIYDLRFTNDELGELLEFLELNFQSLPYTPPEFRSDALANAQAILHTLYQQLIAPYVAQLCETQHLIIVPHGLLHYVPFHALYDGSTYVVERWGVSYLPNLSVMNFYQPPAQADSHLIVGFSAENQLPHTITEAEEIADLFASDPITETQATRAILTDKSRGIVHLATHGDFRADNPLFSGLTLADGQLTTLDLFNLRLPASLVTLSACQTGINVVGAGDELQGLMRGFSVAGAASLLLTLWQVEDETTHHLMLAFYKSLLNGASKVDALQDAQCAMLHENATAHPYFWASFLLVGHTGKL